MVVSCDFKIRSALALAPTLLSRCRDCPPAKSGRDRTAQPACSKTQLAADWRFEESPLDREIRPERNLQFWHIQPAQHKPGPQRYSSYACTELQSCAHPNRGIVGRCVRRKLKFGNIGGEGRRELDVK